MTCENCIYYKPKNAYVGECRFSEPTMNGWPKVEAEDWCGCFEPAEAGDDEGFGSPVSCDNAPVVYGADADGEGGYVAALRDKKAYGYCVDNNKAYGYCVDNGKPKKDA